MPSSTVPPKFHIPTVDIAPYLASPTSPEAQKIVDSVRQACLTTGFFQLVGHGIPPSLQAAVFAGSAAFFALPAAEKLALDKSASVGASNRGYEILGNQGLQEGTLPDLKEGFYIGQHIDAEDPRVKNKAFLMGPNLWPKKELVPEKVFKEPMEAYFKAMFQLSLTVMDVLAAGLPYGPDVFSEFVSNDAVSSIRLLHYPPDKSQDDNQLGAGAHTDFGAITLLLQDGTGGLQVWDDEGKEWRDVVPNPAGYVVNVGDMLQMWTGGMYKSSLHRVINRSGGDRYSVPFFFDGNIDTVIRPLDGSEPKDGVVLTVQEHMRERFQSTYGRGKKRADGTTDINV